MPPPEKTPKLTGIKHVGRPNLGNLDTFRARLDKILSVRWLSNGGRFVNDFEAGLASYLGVSHCVAMCNATVAIEIVTNALGLHGEVIVPSFTFVATAHALQWRGITPVFADIDPTTHNLDPAAVEAAITPDTSAIMGVHLWGRPCPINELQAIADRHGIKLIFDASHALGCSYDDKPIGGFGEAEVFSFHATKFVNSFEGGVVATNSDDLAHRLRMIKNFGFVDYDQVDYLGTNGKMSEVHAAMGLTNLESVDKFITINRLNNQAYHEGLAKISCLRLIDYGAQNQSNYQYVVAEIDPPTAPISRDEVLRRLHAENIIARRYFYPGCHRMEPYKTEDPNAGQHLPNTEALCERVLVLPTGTSVDPETIAHICTLIRNALS